MGRPKRTIQAAAQESLTPPDSLSATQSLARILKAQGSSVYSCELPSGKSVLAELAPRFRNTIWVKRGGYVLVDMAPLEDRREGSQAEGEIINVVRDERAWRKERYWPKEFAKQVLDNSDDSDSNVGKLPPSDSEEEED